MSDFKNKLAQLNKIARKNNTKQKLSLEEISFVKEMKRSSNNKLRSFATEIIPNIIQRPSMKIDKEFNFFKGLGFAKHKSINVAFARC